MFKSTQVKVKYESSGSNNISFDSEKPSYVVEFTNSTTVGIKWSVVKKYQLDVPNVTNEMNEVLKNLILEQPLTKYTLNSSLAKEKGKSQIEVHLGSGQATNWRSMRNQHDLNNNPSPNATTGFKLDKGNAYRKLSESWPIYQPIDGTKQGKGKDQSGWQSSEENTAASDAPSVTEGGGGGSESNNFTNYLNTKQALESIGILFDDQTPRNVITQLYYVSTNKLAVTNDHVVVMGNSFLPSLWYWVVERSATTDSSSKPTWFANTNLDWGEDKQKQFVENQLGYKETTSTNSHNFHSKSFTQPAYFISGIDSVNDQLIFSGFKAGSVGYDSSSSSSSSTKDQALAWSTTTSLDSKTGYKDLVTNETGLNGPINGSFSIQDTFSFVVPYSSNHTNNGTTGTIKTAYPVKNTEKSTVKINSLINATPLNSYGDWSHSPNLYFVLLVPKVVVEYHNLNNQVVKESLGVESSSSFNPTQRLQKDSPMKDSNKDSEKLAESMSSMSSGSGATSPRKALEVEVEKQSGSTDSLLKNDFAKKPLKHKNSSGEVKLAATSEFANDKAWKPLLTTEQIAREKGMGVT